MSKIWAVILAAGESKRMGFPKMLLEFNGKTMLANVISNILEAGIENVMVVTGAERESLHGIIAGNGVFSCHNSHYREGMLSSVQCGFRSLPGDAGAVFVFQGDQPLISPATINLMAGSFAASGKGIMIPVYENKRGHPLLIDIKYRDEIHTLSAGVGLRELTLKHPEDIVELKTDDPGILMDFDTYEEYRKEINKYI